MANVLIIDDNQQLCEMLKDAFTKKNVNVRYALTLRQGLDQLFSGDIDVVFLDVALPDGNGLEAIPKIKGHPCEPEIIVITGHGDQEGADIAIKAGVWDYIPKGGSHKEFELSFERALKYRNRKTESEDEKKIHRPEIIGESHPINDCLEKVMKASKTDSPVLIRGETGTGKELFAKAIHQNSNRNGNEFIVVDCAALPEELAESVLFGHTKGAFTSAGSDKIGLIQLADRGTLFLDEIGELSPGLQKKFLRVLQEKRFRPIGGKKEISSDFRLVAATHRDLRQLVKQGKFREDLLYRIASIKIEIPPLRQRKGDIPILVRYFLKQHYNENTDLVWRETPEFLKELLLYDWPGNIRELIGAVHHACSDSYPVEELFPKNLPDHIRRHNITLRIDKNQASDSSPLPNNEIPFEKLMLKAFVEVQKEEYISRLISYTGGDIKTACELSGLSKGHLYSLLRKYKISD